MESAFGIDHGEIEKGLKDNLQIARLHGKTVVQGAKLNRLHTKKALTDAGYPTKFGANVKESFKAGLRGPNSGRAYKEGHKSARSAGHKRAMADIQDIGSGRKPGSVFRVDPGMVDAGSAKFKRGLSQQDWRLK